MADWADEYDGDDVDPDDVAGTGEEDFVVGMKQNAMEYDAADADQDRKLDFGEFCNWLRDREEGDFTEAEMRARFDAMDADHNGKVDISEYLTFSLRDALKRAGTRVVDLFRKWDEDKSGTVEKKEFWRAVRAMGFEVDREESDACFDSLDDDGSGKLEYSELNTMLRKDAACNATKANLKRAPKQADRSRSAKLTAKGQNLNYVGLRAAALPPMVRLEASDHRSVQEQLFDALTKHSVKLIDLFREWDDDGNGGLDKKEFRAAVAALGYDAPSKEVDAIFDSFDVDVCGFIEYEGFKRGLSRGGVKLAREAMDKKALADGVKREDLPSERRKRAERHARVEATRKPPQSKALDAAPGWGGKKPLSYCLAENNVKVRATTRTTDAPPLCKFAHRHSQSEPSHQRLLQVLNKFHEWDLDGNGSLDRAELHKVVSALFGGRFDKVRSLTRGG